MHVLVTRVSVAMQEASITMEDAYFSRTKQITYVKKISSIITEETVKCNYFLSLAVIQVS
jgi:hypothetical protein